MRSDVERADVVADVVVVADPDDLIQFHRQQPREDLDVLAGADAIVGAGRDDEVKIGRHVSGTGDPVESRDLRVAAPTAGSQRYAGDHHAQDAPHAEEPYRRELNRQSRRLVTTMTDRTTRAVPFCLWAAVVAVALLVAACGDGGVERPATLAGTVREPAPQVAEVSLPDAAGGRLPMRAEDDGLLLVYFGYTSCPDVCPTTMSDLRAAIGRLDAADQQRVEVAMITIDPARDSGDLLTRYVRTFVPDGHALRTDDDAELRAAADAFGADYSVTSDADDDPAVAHTAWVYVVDDAGRLRVQWSFGTPAEDIAADLGLLLTDTKENA